MERKIYLMKTLERTSWNALSDTKNTVTKCNIAIKYNDDNTVASIDSIYKRGDDKKIELTGKFVEESQHHTVNNDLFINSDSDEKTLIPKTAPVYFNSHCFEDVDTEKSQELFMQDLVPNDSKYTITYDGDCARRRFYYIDNENDSNGLKKKFEELVKLLDYKKNETPVLAIEENTYEQGTEYTHNECITFYCTNNVTITLVGASLNNYQIDECIIREIDLTNKIVKYTYYIDGLKTVYKRNNALEVIYNENGIIGFIEYFVQTGEKRYSYQVIDSIGVTVYEDSYAFDDYGASYELVEGHDREGKVFYRQKGEYVTTQKDKRDFTFEGTIGKVIHDVIGYQVLRNKLDGTWTNSDMYYVSSAISAFNKKKNNL